MAVKRNTASASGRPTATFAWVAEAETATTMEELADDGSFETLSIKMAAGLMKRIHGEFRRQIDVIEEKQANEGRMLSGRQLYWLILQEVSRPAAEKQVGSMEELLELELKFDNLRAFQTDWDRLLLAMPVRPTDEWLELLYCRQI
jgi:hypothetical protein